MVQRSANQNETGSGERTKRFTVNVVPESPAVGFVKPGDRVDLYLPDFEHLVVINANEVYVQPQRLIANSVPVATFTEYLQGELRMTVLLTAAEVSRIKSNPTWHDIGKMTITHVVRLKNASADHVVELLRQSFPFGVRDDDSAQNSLVSCESDLKQNAVILKEQPFSDDKPLRLIDVEAAIRKLDAPVDGKVGEARSVRVLPDTPAAKQLVEQLNVQESAAVATAATIRELQSNGQAEQNKPAIADHHHKLKNLLNTAFDLKLIDNYRLKAELQTAPLGSGRGSD